MKLNYSAVVYHLTYSLGKIEAYAIEISHEKRLFLINGDEGGPNITLFGDKLDNLNNLKYLMLTINGSSQKHMLTIL